MAATVNVCNTYVWGFMGYGAIMQYIHMRPMGNWNDNFVDAHGVHKSYN